jgi:hypothetical protein
MSFALFLAASLLAATATAPTSPAAAAAVAREVTRDVNGALDRLDRVAFTARRPDVAYDSQLVAWADTTGVRKIEATDLDDSGSVVGEYYFRDGELVFAYVATKGWQGDREVTRHERRQYFQRGAMVTWLDGMEKAPRAPDDAEFAAEARERIAAATFFRDAALRELRQAGAAPAADGTAAAGSDTVLIGGEAKPATATVVDLSNGDTACLVELRDAAGRTQYEPADFEICFQQPSLVGRRVALDWAMANVQADSCGGDPDCSDSERVALITAARILDEPASNVAPASFCASDEIVVFACRTGAKQVSVCAARDASATTGYAQYRFGTPGPGGSIELEWPATRIPAAQAATADNLPFSGGGASWLRFRRGDHAYIVYSGIGQWGPNGETEERAGVVVERDGARIAHRPCDGGRSDGILGPDWFDQAGLTGDDQGFELPD